jgi:uncharacterized protein
MTFTREQVLGLLIATAVFLLVIAEIWGTLAGIPVGAPFHLNGRDFGLGLLLGLGIMGLSVAVYSVWPQYRDSANEYLSLVLKPLALQDTIWVGLLPGLSEELFFRGIALPALGLVLSSLLFGVAHLLDRRQWPYALWASGVGVLLGLAMLWSQNLLVPIVAHVTTNILSTLFWRIRLSPGT